MAITVFDGVAKFSADSSQLDQFIVKLEQGLTTASEKAAASTRDLKSAQEEFRAAISLVSAEGGDTAANMSRLAEAEQQLALAAAAAKQEHANLKSSLADAGSAASETGGSMHEARGAIALLGEEIGVHVPRHVQTFIAGLPGVQTALSAAFAPVAILAVIELGAKLVEKIEEIRGHAEVVAAAWQKMDDDASAAFTHTGDEITRVEAQIDEMNNDKVGALEKNLELLDHASLAELSKQIEQITKDADDAFTKMQTWWDWLSTFGEGNAGVKAIQSQFDDMTRQYQNLLKFGAENPDPFGSLRTSLDGARKKLDELTEAQGKASGEQKSLIGEEVAAQQKRVAAMEFLQTQGDGAKAKLKDLQDQQKAAEQAIADAANTAGEGMELAVAAAVAHKEAIDKDIEAQEKDVTALGHYVNLQVQSNKLEQDKITLETGKAAKGEAGAAAAQAQAELAAEKTVDDALVALRKATSLEEIQTVENTYSTMNATTKEGFAQQLQLITSAEIAKRQVEANAQQELYELQKKAIEDRLAELQKEGSKTLAEQTKLRADLVALDTKHAADTIANYQSMMERLRTILSQPIPLINELPPGMDAITNEITKNFDKAEAAAQALGITLRADLESGMQATWKEYQKLVDLFDKGVISSKDLDAAYIKLVQAQLDFAKATGASADAVKKLEQQLADLTGKQGTNLTNFGKHSHQTWQDFVNDMKNGVNGMDELKSAGIDMFDSLSSSMASAVASAIMGQDSFGAAMEKALAQALANIAGQAVVKALFYTAEGFAALASLDPTGAAEFFEAAGIMGAVGAAAGIAGHALAGASGTGATKASKSGGSSSSKGTHGAAGTSSPTEPTETVNVEHLAAGGIAYMPMLAMIGDSPRGGGASEAVIPLESRTALDTIADALVPPLLAAMAKQGAVVASDTGVARFFDGGLVSAPMLAMIGDNAAGGAAAEGVLPLEDDAAMSRIASSIASQFRMPATPRYEAGATSDMLPRSTLEAASAALEHSVSVRSTAEYAPSPAQRDRDAQQIAKAIATALDGKTPMGGQISIQLESDIPQLLKKINHSVATGKGRLMATNSVRLTRRG